jgi:uncharacterized secreted protein with C-terminal beta-propeller domain
MTETTRTGGTGIGAALGVLGLIAAVSVGAIALGSGTAGASGLEQFDSCAELEAWTGEARAMTEVTFSEGDDDGTDLATTEDAAAAPMAPGASAGSDGAGSGRAADVDTEQSTAASDDSAAGGDTGGTNTVVEGVDEVDVIDRLGERLLVSRNGALALVDLATRSIVAEQDGLPWDARVSVAGDLIWVAGGSLDGTGTEVRRLRVDGDAFVEDGTWSTPGYLQDARRTGDRLHLVAVDHPQPGVVPFDDGPVPCDQVWRPTDPATTPAATLVVSLPATGALEPVAAAEVTGSAGNLLVTGESVYVATESWDEAGTVTTGVHRFELEDLAPTGSGSVPGSVAGPFALNEHEGTLRVATNAGSGFGFGRGIPVEGDIAIDTPAVAEESTGSLAEVFVFDTEGDLDMLGRTGRFGHDGETIHGVRFIGEVAYVVTFLQTDPFWVVDLADPAAPAVVGELEIPGFSGYLHPAGDGRVVGFGPDGNGTTAARLFDVSDPAAPSVLDEIVLGDDSPVAYDHHAFVGLGDGRFAVPFTDYPEYREVTDCQPPVTIDPVPVPLPEPLPVDPGIGDGTSGSTGIATPAQGADLPPEVYCEPIAVGGETGAAVLAVADGRLTLVERASVPGADVYAERIAAAPDGTWFLLSWDRLVATDDGSAIVLPTGEGVAVEDAEG